jgi:hypothetical protein
LPLLSSLRHAYYCWCCHCFSLYAIIFIIAIAILLLTLLLRLRPLLDCRLNNIISTTLNSWPFRRFQLYLPLLLYYVIIFIIIAVATFTISRFITTHYVIGHCFINIIIIASSFLSSFQSATIWIILRLPLLLVVSSMDDYFQYFH